MKIGIISDTHGLLRPEVAVRLAGVSHIIHAGDIGSPDIISALGKIAPVSAIRGNVDTGDWAWHYPEQLTVRLAERSFHVVHDIDDLRPDELPRDLAVIVYGHSHRAGIRAVDGVVYVNPGSAGPRRFRLPVTLATLDLGQDRLEPVIHHLGDDR